MTEAATGLDTGEALDRVLMERVLDAVPVSQPAFSKLLSLLDIRASREIPTACVTLGGRSRLWLNPDFIAAHCRTDAALGMLVMHELLHVLLGHTRLFPRVTPAHNIAFDALINAQLCLRFPDPAHTALFRELYPEEDLPWVLLRPPADWPGDRARWSLPGEAGRLHRALYTETSVTTVELFEMIRRELSLGEPAVLALGRLLGSHDANDTRDGACDPDLMRALRDIVARWPMHQRISGRDEGGEVVTERLRRIEARREAVAVLRRALWPLLDLRTDGTGAGTRAPLPAPTLLPYRTRADRRAEVRSLCGHEPLFFEGRARHWEWVRGERVHVYVDVSGSMAGELPLIYGALGPLTSHLHPRIHLFSTRVEDINPEALRRGWKTSTEGTDIACVTQHLLEHRIARAMLVTDGWVGETPAEHLRRLRRRRVRLACVITHEGDVGFAGVLHGTVHRLPPLSGQEEKA